MSVLIEHYAGAFPVWLAPMQVRILPVSEKFEEYAKQVREMLEKESIRVKLGAANETLGKRIRGAELEKIPYILVVGEKEMNAKTVNVRNYKKGNVGELDLEKFLENIKVEISEKR